MDTRGPMAAAIPSLTRLGKLADARDAFERQLFEEVAYARSMGASWRMIGVAVGTSTQAAWEKYRPTRAEVSQPEEEQLPLDQP